MLGYKGKYCVRLVSNRSHVSITTPGSPVSFLAVFSFGFYIFSFALFHPLRACHGCWPCLCSCCLRSLPAAFSFLASVHLVGAASLYSLCAPLPPPAAAFRCSFYPCCGGGGWWARSAFQPVYHLFWEKFSLKSFSSRLSHRCCPTCYFSYFGYFRGQSISWLAAHTPTPHPVGGVA